VSASTFRPLAVTATAAITSAGAGASPLSVPILLEIGRISVAGSGDQLLRDAAEALIAEAIGG